MALLRREPEPELAAALAAIPGVPTAATGVPWALRLGPDRAHSLKLVAAACSLEMDPASRRNAARLAGSRDPDSQVIETTGEGELWLSLMDDWHSLWAEELRAIPGGRERQRAGRYEVPLTRWTVEAIGAIARAHALRLSPAADLALREAATEPDAPEPPADDGDDDGDETAEHDIEMQPDGGHIVVRAGGAGALARHFAGLPGAHRVDPERWLVPATPEAARDLRTIVASHATLELDEAASAWLREAPRWIARVDVDTHAKKPAIRVRTRWGEPPDEVTSMPGIRRHNAGRHYAPLTLENLATLAHLIETESELSVAADITRSLEWVEGNPAAEMIPAAELDVIEDRRGRRLTVEPIWDERAADAFLIQQAALVQTSRDKAAEVPAEAWPPDVLARFIRTRRVSCTPAAARFVEGVVAGDAEAQRLLELSYAEDAELEVEGLGGELMPFQRAGVAYALERRRLFLADEQGLGKTIEALATIQADGAFPAVVIAPASLKLNWLRETGIWLPERSARMVAGRTATELDGSDIVVCNYEIVASHLDALAELRPRALVLDESHYVKNPRAARTKAVLDLSERLAPDALRMALTGTPVVNHTAELATQLQALGRLSEYGTATSFKHAYSSPRSRRRLHERLRSSCYLRRRKSDVLEQLPEKRRAVVTVPIDNEPEYRFAERDFVRWLREQAEEEDGGRLSPKLRSAALVKMTALRRLAAEGKLAAAMSWIDDFRESDERLIVFAHHRKIQRAVLDRFPGSAQIIGSDRAAERERNVQLFQTDDGPQICVCSLEVASHGFTLTAAANVAFLELAWTPAKHDQAEDRTHRIGQERSVTSWYLLAAETIDERIAALLEEKRGVVDSVTDGGEGGGTSIAAELIDGYADGR